MAPVSEETVIVGGNPHLHGDRVSREDQAVSDGWMAGRLASSDSTGCLEGGTSPIVLGVSGNGGGAEAREELKGEPRPREERTQQVMMNGTSTSWL